MYKPYPLGFELVYSRTYLLYLLASDYYFKPTESNIVLVFSFMILYFSVQQIIQVFE